MEPFLDMPPALICCFKNGRIGSANLVQYAMYVVRAIHEIETQILRTTQCAERIHVAMEIQHGYQKSAIGKAGSHNP
jgi:hypothetical protein